MKKFILFFSVLALCFSSQAQPFAKVLKHENASADQLALYKPDGDFIGMFEEVGYVYVTPESSFHSIMNADLEEEKKGQIAKSSFTIINYYYGVGEDNVYYYPETNEVVHLLDTPLHIDGLCVLGHTVDETQVAWEVRTETGLLLLQSLQPSNPELSQTPKLYVCREDGVSQPRCLFALESNGRRPKCTVYNFRTNKHKVLSARTWKKIKQNLEIVDYLSESPDAAVEAVVEDLEEVFKL